MPGISLHITQIRQTLTVLLLFVLPFACLKSQQKTLLFEHIGLEQGLPEGQILGLLQDSHGFIWFGTMSGLVRYDGFNFVKYAHQSSDTTSLSHSTAWPCIEDSKGNIWIGSHTGLNCWNRVTNNFRRFFHDLSNPGSLPGAVAETVFEDKTGLLWVGTDNGLAWYDGTLFHTVSISNASSTGVYVYSILEDGKGNILAGTTEGLVKILSSKQSGTLIPVTTGGSKGSEIRELFKDREQRIWVGTDAGLFLWNDTSATFTPVPLMGTPKQQAIRSIIQDDHGLLWMATLNGNGMFRLDPASGAVQHFRQDPANSFGLSSNYVREFMIDQLNNLWIGTYNGLNKVNLNPPRFTLLQQEPGDLRSENLIYKAYADTWGGLWFSTYEQQGFYAKQPGEKAVETDFLPYNSEEVLLENFCSTAEGEVWIATWPASLIRYSVKTGKASMIEGLPEAGDSLEIMPFFYLEEDISDPDFMWTSSNSGLCRIHKKTLERTYFPPARDLPDLKNNWIVNAIQANGNHIYVLLESNFNGRLARFNKQTGKYQPIETAKAYPEGKNTIHVRQFALTPDGTVWMATAAGLGKYAPYKDLFSLLTSRDGLVEDNLMGIAADRSGNVWLKSLVYLSKYHPGTGAFWHFNVSKDMKEFNAVGTATGPGGHMFFYGNNGFYAFHPDSVRLDSTLPKIILTDFKILNESRQYGTSPELIRNITLGYSDNVFSFEWAALHFRNPANNRYRYRLAGFDDKWMEAGTERKVTYTNLDAGRYAFQVMACNADGVWNPESLTVELRILPPPWASWWAYCLYIIAASAAAYAFYFYKKRQWQVEAQLEMEHQEAERLKELDSVKTKLYTNITHEFRTPLTIILGMVKQVRTNPKDWYSQGIKMIERNAKNLLRLVNQMLDLSKLEAGALPVLMEQGDVVAYIKYLLESFYSMAGSKDIRLQFQSEYDKLITNFDAEKLREIVTNLLSNAIKFTPAGGLIKVEVRFEEPENLIITVEDSGIGIPAENLPYIFDRFYQADDKITRMSGGTGIGLTLTKELVKLLGGEISVKSEVGKGARFTIKLPCEYFSGIESTSRQPDTYFSEAPTGSAKAVDAGVADNQSESRKKQAIVLLVEDNKDMIRYLQSFLASKYRLIVTSNGRQGIEKALKSIPDIIISDVMMPEVDGFELCATLKKNERTSHIPIILLTAKADAASRLEGLECGADAYLAKPFENEELLVRIRKLLELRQRLRDQFSANGWISLPDDRLASAEDVFMKKLRTVLEENFSDENLDIPHLCQALHMSRSQLYRKINALTGKPIGHLLRSYRMQRAKVLLETTDLSVTQVALEVGYKYLAHFSRTFQQEFGVSPSKIRNGDNDATT